MPDNDPKMNLFAQYLYAIFCWRYRWYHSGRGLTLVKPPRGEFGYGTEIHLWKGERP